MAARAQRGYGERVSGPAAREAWERENLSVAWFDDVDGQLVLTRVDGDTGIVALNVAWLRAQGYGRHIERDGEIIRVANAVFRRIRPLTEALAAYRVYVELGTDAPG